MYKKFYQTIIKPSNAILVIAGAVTQDEIRLSSEKWFGPISNKKSRENYQNSRFPPNP